MYCYLYNLPIVLTGFATFDFQRSFPNIYNEDILFIYSHPSQQVTLRDSHDTYVIPSNEHFGN